MPSSISASYPLAAVVAVAVVRAAGAAAATKTATLAAIKGHSRCSSRGFVAPCPTAFQIENVERRVPVGLCFPSLFELAFLRVISSQLSVSAGFCHPGDEGKLLIKAV